MLRFGPSISNFVPDDHSELWLVSVLMLSVCFTDPKGFNDRANK